MIRGIAAIVGVGFSAAVLWGVLPYAGKAYPDAVAQLRKETKSVPFAHDGVFGVYDRAQLQRGFQVYKEVCSACHSLKLVTFASLQGIGFSAEQVKALAKTYDVATTDDKGEPTTRKGVPSDALPGPFANEDAARAANNGALPPDFSLIASAREGGLRHVYSIVTGYGENGRATYKKLVDEVDAQGHKHKVEKTVPFETPAGQYYNPYFANLNIAMPPPLTADGQVTYADGTKATRQQMAEDVSVFLDWASQPKLEARKRMGAEVLVFLSLLVGVTYVSKRRIWASVAH